MNRINFLQEEKIKKLATKLIRVLSDKKRLEMAGGGGGMAGGTSGVRRDIETEELIEDQQQKIRELERQTTHLKEKLMVAKQQLLAVNSGLTENAHKLISSTLLNYCQ